MALKPCRECAKDVSTAARTCPHCGVGSPTGPRWNPIAAALIVLAIVGFCAKVSPGAGNAVSGIFSRITQPAVSTEAAKLAVVNWWFNLDDHGYRTIVGTARNDTNRKYKSVSILFILYDKHGEQLGAAMASDSDIEPHATWKFSTNVFEDSVARASARASVYSIEGF